MAQPRAVVFDIGGVLLDWDPRYLYRKLLADDVPTVVCSHRPALPGVRALQVALRRVS